MKRITIIIAITMGCIFAGESNVLSTLKQIAKSIEAKYPNITNVSPSAPTRQGSENTNRDMGDIVGEWHGESRTDDMYITVGSDQTHPNVSQMMALEEGEGNIHVVTEAFETDL
ncbi:MAG: hypothetical protein HOC46_04115, partial [Candidatus Marinimicrobia bacterium]|nr:hypothetical protein [Candidatus Neomarinimicrobiota bacterium]